MFKCWQVRVIYAPDVPFGHSNDTSVSEISDGSWVDLTRYDTLENQVVHIKLTYACSRNLHLFPPKKILVSHKSTTKNFCLIYYFDSKNEIEEIIQQENRQQKS